MHRFLVRDKVIFLLEGGDNLSKSESSQPHLDKVHIAHIAHEIPIEPYTHTAAVRE